MPRYFKSLTIDAYGSERVLLSTANSHIFLNCKTPSGCLVLLSAQYHSDSPAIIGAIIGPILFIAFCSFIVIALVIARRRRMLMLAATSSPTNSPIAYSKENYIPVSTPISENTTFAETNYGNQAHLQPATNHPYYKPGVVVYPTIVSEPMTDTNL